MNLTNAYEAIYNGVITALEDGGSSLKDVTVWDYVPVNKKPPFIILADIDPRFPSEIATKTSVGYEMTQKIIIVTEAREKLKALSIHDAITKKLLEDLHVEGSEVYRQSFANGKIREVDDGLYIAETFFTLLLEDE